jgi:hypothetical protein
VSAGRFGRTAWTVATVLVPVTLAAGTIACRSRAEREAELANGDDPLAALRASVSSTRYTTRYWTATAQRDAHLWSRAQAYCEERRASSQGDEPNCAAVEAARFEFAGRAVRPAVPGARQRFDSLTFRP